jgi:hypothetical protein
MRNWLKEIGNKVVTNLAGTLILAVLALIVPTTRNLLKLYWKQILFFIVLTALIYIVLYLFKKNRKNESDISTLKADIYDIKNKKPLPKESGSAEIENLNRKVTKIEDDLYELKRSNFYKKAEDYEKSEKRGALLCRLDVIDLDIKKGYEFNLEESLEDLFRYVKKQTGFLTQDLSDVKNCLNKISNDGHKEVVDQILSQIKSKI